MNILNAIAGILVLVGAVRALVLFHCKVTIWGRLSLAAVAFCAWSGVATGALLELRGVAHLVAMVAGLGAGVFLWKTRDLNPVCHLIR